MSISQSERLSNVMVLLGVLRTPLCDSDIYLRAVSGLTLIYFFFGIFSSHSFFIHSLFTMSKALTRLTPLKVNNKESKASGKQKIKKVVLSKSEQDLSKRIRSLAKKPSKPKTHGSSTGTSPVRRSPVQTGTHPKGKDHQPSKPSRSKGNAKRRSSPESGSESDTHFTLPSPPTSPRAKLARRQQQRTDSGTESTTSTTGPKSLARGKRSGIQRRIVPEGVDQAIQDFEAKQQNTDGEEEANRIIEEAVSGDYISCFAEKPIPIGGDNPHLLDDLDIMDEAIDGGTVDCDNNDDDDDGGDDNSDDSSDGTSDDRDDNDLPVELLEDVDSEDNPFDATMATLGDVVTVRIRELVYKTELYLTAPSQRKLPGILNKGIERVIVRSAEKREALDEPLHPFTKAFTLPEYKNTTVDRLKHIVRMQTILCEEIHTLGVSQGLRTFFEPILRMLKEETNVDDEGRREKAKKAVSNLQYCLDRMYTIAKLDDSIDEEDEGIRSVGYRQIISIIVTDVLVRMFCRGKYRAVCEMDMQRAARADVGKGLRFKEFLDKCIASNSGQYAFSKTGFQLAVQCDFNEHVHSYNPKHLSVIQHWFAGLVRNTHISTPSLPMVLIKTKKPKPTRGREPDAYQFLSGREKKLISLCKRGIVHFESFSEKHQELLKAIMRDLFDEGMRETAVAKLESKAVDMSQQEYIDAKESLYFQTCMLMLSTAFRLTQTDN